MTKRPLMNDIARPSDSVVIWDPINGEYRTVKARALADLINDEQADIIYDTPQDMINSEEAARGLGARWATYEGYQYQEAPTSFDGWHVTNAAGVKLIPLPQPLGSLIYCPEMLGNLTNRSFVDTYKGMPANSTISLKARTYRTVRLDIFADPTNLPNSDSGKSIRGAVSGARFGAIAAAPTAEFAGTVIMLDDGQNTDLITVNSNVSGFPGAFAANAISDVHLHGNRSNNTGSGRGLLVDNIKDLQLHNVYVSRCSGDGIDFNSNLNAIEISGFLDVFLCDGRGITGQIGDLLCEGAIKSHSNGGINFNLGVTQGRIASLYCYFGDTDSVVIGAGVAQGLSIGFLRIDDAGRRGLVNSGLLSIDYLTIRDSGAMADTSNTQRTGLFLQSGSTTRIGVYTIPVRDNPFIIRNTTRTLNVQPGARGSIRTLEDYTALAHLDATDLQYNMPSLYRTAILPEGDDLGGFRVIERLTYEDSYALIERIGNEIQVRADSFDTIICPDLPANTVVGIANPESNSAAQGSEISFSLTASGDGVQVDFGTLYRNTDGSNLDVTTNNANFDIDSGDTLVITFRRQGTLWTQVGVVRNN